MNITIITLGALLAGASFIAGRSCIITERLRRANKKGKETIAALRGDKEQTDKECSVLTTQLVSLQNPYAEHKRTFSVMQLYEGCCAVIMSVEICGRKADSPVVVSIPVKTFTDEEDPDFARSEAEEFRAKCEEQ